MRSRAPELWVALRTNRAALYRTYLGHASLDEAQREGSVRVEGSRRAVQTFFEAFRQSPVADIVRSAEP